MVGRVVVVVVVCLFVVYCFNFLFHEYLEAEKIFLMGFYGFHENHIFSANLSTN